MKQLILQICIACVCLASCAYDDVCNLIESDQSYGDWKVELMNIVNEFDDVFEKSGVQLIEYKKISNTGLDSTCFFNEKSVVPVYLGGLDRFELFPYDIVVQDTFSLHFRKEHLVKRVKNVLNNYELTVVKLLWCHNGNKFNSIALFNANTGELEYDNILYNVFKLKTISSDRKKLLTRGEGGSGNGNNINDHYEVSYFYNRNNEMAAYTWSRWIEHGHFKTTFIHDIYNRIIGQSYEYVHDSFEHYSGGWTCNNELLSAFTVFKDESTSNYGQFKKYVYVGPKNEAPSNDSQLNQTINPGGHIDQSYCSTSDRWFGCLITIRVDCIQNMPTRLPTYF